MRVRLVGVSLLAAALLVAPGCGADGSTAGEATGDEPPEAGAPVEGAASATTAPAPEKLSTVAKVVDGDTIVLGNDTRVRLVQIDSPEVGEECFAAEAGHILSAILPEGTKVRLVADPKLDDVDRYDRLLRYVFEGKTNVNLALVRRGAASVWFYDGDRGRYADELLRAARRARAAGRGLWGACPGTKLDPTRAVATVSAESETPAEAFAPEPRPAGSRSARGTR